MKRYENAKRFPHGYACSSQKMFYHQLRFLIGYFSVGQMWYVIKKKINEKVKSTIFDEKQKNAKKVYVNIN